MSLRILLYLQKSGGETDSFVSWRTIQQNHADPAKGIQVALTGSGSISDFLDYYQNIFSASENRKKKLKKVDVIGVLPGIFVTYASVSIPTNNRKKIIQAIPFLVEDFLIGELDEMHIRMDKNIKDGKARVAIVEKKLINDWLSLFDSLNIQVSGIYGAQDIISISNNEAKIIFNDDDEVVFKSYNFCLSTSIDNFKKIFSSISIDGIEVINIFCDLSEKIPAQISRKIKIEVESEGVAKVEIFDFSGKITDGYDRFGISNLDNAIDLVEKNNDNFVGIYHDFFMPIGIAVALIAIIQIGFNVSSGLYFSKYAGIILESSKLYYATLFIDDPVTDIRSQWDGRLKNSISVSPDKSFSFIFSSAMRELSVYKNGKNNFKLEEFRFDSESGNIKINIEIDSIATLDSLKERLKKNSIDMEILSANSDKDIIKASIVVQKI